jgi:hypothetical protein
MTSPQAKIPSQRKPRLCGGADLLVVSKSGPPTQPCQNCAKTLFIRPVARAQAAIDDFAKHLTEEEKKSGVFFCWEYTSRRIGRRN